MFFIRKQIGVTLIELTVVLLVLVALAGVVIPYIGGTSSTALCNATDVTMQNIKKVIMERYYLDTLGYFPKSTKTGTDYNLRYLFESPAVSASGGWDTFNPETHTGWRQGGYLQSGTQLSVNPDMSFQDSTKVHDSIIAGQIQVLDGWGRPIILRVDCNNLTGIVDCARLISAGSGTGLGISEAVIDTSINGNRQNDDRILYLNAPTPVNNGVDNIANTSDDNTENPSCSEN